MAEINTATAALLTWAMAGVTGTIADPNSVISVGAASVGGGVVSAWFKYRGAAHLTDAEEAAKKIPEGVAMADYGIAILVGVLIGWFGHDAGVNVINNLTGVEPPKALSALVLSLAGITIVEKAMTGRLKWPPFSKGGK